MKESSLVAKLLMSPLCLKFLIPPGLDIFIAFNILFGSSISMLLIRENKFFLKPETDFKFVLNAFIIGAHKRIIPRL